MLSGKIRVLHFTKIINRNDFIDVIVRNANPDKFYLMTSTYKDFSNIEDPCYRQEGVPFFVLNIEHGWIDMFKGAWRLSKLLKEHQVDILHTHHYYEAVIGMMACLLNRNTVHIVGRHYHNQFYLTAKGIKLKFYLFVESVVNRIAKAIVVPSSLIVELLQKQGVQLSKIKFIPYCFDFTAKRYQELNSEVVNQRRKELRWEGKFVIGNISRHHKIKGQTYLFHAFKKIQKEIPNSRLVMIGDGPAHEELKAEAKELDILDSLIFLGWRKDAHELINLMDVVVHPSLQEAFPQLMIEVMALGKPLVITPVSGATDVVTSGVNGFLVPFQNAEEIEKAIGYIYRNKELMKTISANAKEFVRQNFPIKKVIPLFEDLYTFSVMK